MTQLNEQNFQMSSMFPPIKLGLQGANQTDPLPRRQESSVALGSSWLKITMDKGGRRVVHQTECCQTLRGSEGRKQ